MTPEPVDDFLERFSTSLRGGWRWRRDTVAEIRHHLLDLSEDRSVDIDSFDELSRRFGDPARLATELSREHKVTTMHERTCWAGKVVLVAGTACVVIVGALGLWVGSPTGRESPPMAAFASGVRSSDDAAQVAGLADAARRWTVEAPETGPGEPLTALTTRLLPIGGRAETLRAFPTSRGRVCFEILGAGTCGKLDAASPIAVGILYTRGAGTRVFGVASDEITRVQVDVAGSVADATLGRNGFYYRLPPGFASEDVRRVISTKTDGAIHTLFVHTG